MLSNKAHISFLGDLSLYFSTEIRQVDMKNYGEIFRKNRLIKMSLTFLFLYLVV